MAWKVETNSSEVFIVLISIVCPKTWMPTNFVKQFLFPTVNHWNLENGKKKLMHTDCRNFLHGTITRNGVNGWTWVLDNCYCLSVLFVNNWQIILLLHTIHCCTMVAIVLIFHFSVILSCFSKYFSLWSAASYTQHWCRTLQNWLRSFSSLK